MAQTPGVPLTAAALLCTGFLVGSHPLVTSHPLLRGLTPGVADASTATNTASMVSCPNVNVVAAPMPAPLPARLAALQNAELEEQARRAARREQRAATASA